ncbi:hypothetical protein PTSG_08322 [Salpingoeca rosetta]|uniref:Uncharacterized protein n=1 Tax=Salpingoeca rosetta (strain ATCC 50818 / BSB-021) TaxID=946362 RepID=F2UJD0_SALR5|nr:uncharacterized protein PTSG_08322 [Salpingoeca rosetta]EGD77229.1 hypothetical protein PTSG_08322 [Salpingoeca rosetta]|eukprot:XP_004990573.1 hypothetical protein PTSG_08322 [Salpingoeca rosetta]
MASRIVCQKPSYVKGVAHALRLLCEANPPLVTRMVVHPMQRSIRVARQFDIRVVGESTHGYRLRAKRDNTLQEVFAVTSVPRNMLQYAVDEVIGKNHLARLQRQPLPSGVTDEQYKEFQAQLRAAHANQQSTA